MLREIQTLEEQHRIKLQAKDFLPNRQIDVKLYFKLLRPFAEVEEMKILGHV